MYLTFILYCAVLKLFAREYEVDGEVKETIYKIDGSVQLVKSSKYTVFVKDCSWLIQTTDQDFAGNPILVRETSCVNGTQIYEVQGPGSTSGLNIATIVSNNVPVGETDDYLVCHLWLMYASGCYFANLTTNWLTPAYDLNASAPVNPELKREAKWNLADGPGSLPLNVVYIDERDHSTNATYVMTGVTNVGTIQLASGFVFELRIHHRFAPGPTLPGESVPEYRIRKRAVATVTSVRPVCTRYDLLPAAKGNTYVVDQRLPSPTPTNTLSYFVKNGVKWLSLNDAQNKYIAQPIPRKNRFPVFFAMLLILTAVPLLFLVKNRRK